jgi:carboxyl-terminal processing protease
VRPGWILTSVEGEALAPVISAARANPEIHELQLTRTLLARVSGAPGEVVAAGFLDGRNRPVNVTLRMASPRGEPAVFGNLPPAHLWHEERRIGAAVYFRFNMFLDIPRIMAAFERTLKACGDCRGLILDLRGNPGGIGGMAMGMAGFLIEDGNRRLGTMYMREATLNFVINPRPEVFQGAVAVLLDACSASTSEILAGGLQALGRARVFGTRSAAAALPSVFERLPNGDGFQYAVANYVSLSGQALEGTAVTPDVEIRLTREALLDGRDPVIEAALAWIEESKK